MVAIAPPAAQAPAIHPSLFFGLLALTCTQQSIIETQRAALARARLDQEYRTALDNTPKFGSNGNMRSFVYHTQAYEQRNKPLESGPYAGLYCYDMAAIAGAYGCAGGNAGDQARKIAGAGLMDYKTDEYTLKEGPRKGEKITLSYGRLYPELLSAEGLDTLDSEPITINGGPHILPRCEICGAAIHRRRNTIETQDVDVCENGHVAKAHIPERHPERLDLSYLKGSGAVDATKTTMAPSTVTTGGDCTGESDQAPQNQSGFGKNHTCSPAIALDQAQKKAKTRVVLGAIPAELRAREQWIVWKWGRLDPTTMKRKKPPYSAQPGANPNRAIDHTDPANWSSFDRVAALYQESQSWAIPFDGIGYCFSESDPYAGADFDDCRDPETGALVERAEHMLILSIPGVYAEVSPSGKGFKAIVKGRLAKSIKTDQGELYDRAQYFTVTGVVLPGTQPGALVDAQAELDMLAAALSPAAAPPSDQAETTAACAATIAADDSALLARAGRARNGAGEKFTRLWQGDTSGYGSHSQADLALCSLLAYYTGNDRDRIDRLFRDSGLMRAKWDRSAGGGLTYGQKTIERATRGHPPVETKPSPAPELALTDRGAVVDTPAPRAVPSFVSIPQWMIDTPCQRCALPFQMLYSGPHSSAPICPRCCPPRGGSPQEWDRQHPRKREAALA